MASVSTASARLRPERGLQGHRLVDVRAAGLEVAGRADREVAAVGVKEAGEYGRRGPPGG